jgi:hypothetical protein
MTPANAQAHTPGPLTDAEKAALWDAYAPMLHAMLDHARRLMPTRGQVRTQFVLDATAICKELADFRSPLSLQLFDPADLPDDALIAAMIQEGLELGATPNMIATSIRRMYPGGHRK